MVIHLGKDSDDSDASDSGGKTTEAVKQNKGLPNLKSNLEQFLREAKLASCSTSVGIRIGN